MTLVVKCRNSVYLSFFCCVIHVVNAQSVEKLMPRIYTYEWQKANGDTFDVLIENHLTDQIQLKTVERICLLALLKSVIKSGAFESYSPSKIDLLPDQKVNVLKLEFTILNSDEEKQDQIHYFSFDALGNVYDKSNYP